MKTLKMLAPAAAVVLCLGVACGADKPKPLTESDVLKLVDLKIPDDAIVKRVAEGGVGFPADAAVINRLRTGGASDAVVAAVQKAARSAQDGELVLWVKREYAWDSPLTSDLTVNGKAVGTFTSDADREIGEFLKPGWNTFALKTTLQAGATRNNKLIFKVGPVARQEGKRVMTRALWEFDNGTDWQREGGRLVHRLGPDVKGATLAFRLFLADPAAEARKPAEGDYILSARQEYPWDTPVTGTVTVNGHEVSTFVGVERQVVLTDWLRKGENTIKVVTDRVPNVVERNDIKFQVGGPAEYNVGKRRLEFRPIAQFEAMHGWKRDEKSGKLVNTVKADADTIEREIKFTLDREPGKK